jgi:hypothetical protein
MCRADCWAGVDRVAPVKLRVAEQTRAEREGRVGKRAEQPAAREGGDSGDDAPRERDADADGDEDEEEEEEDEGVRSTLPLKTPKP